MNLWASPTLVALLGLQAPWRTTAFTTSSPREPVTPPKGIVESLTQQVHQLRHQLSLFDSGNSTELPWKQWYTDAEERNRALAIQKDETLQDAVDQIDCLQTALAMAHAERDCLAAEVQQMNNEYAGLQATLDTINQHHVDNIATWQATLDSAEKQMELLKQQNLKEIQLVKEAASVELDTTTNQYESRLAAMQLNLNQVQDRLQQREAKLERRGDRILVLEQEKKSLRVMGKNTLHLLVRRFNKRVDRLVSQSRASSPAVVDSHNSKARTTPRKRFREILPMQHNNVMKRELVTVRAK